MTTDDFPGLLDELDDDEGATTSAPDPAPPKPAADDGETYDDVLADFDDIQADLGLKADTQFRGDLRKPWMKFHKFVLVKTVDEVRELIDKALAHGRCSLDLETQGLDNRIDYDAEGKPKTRHKIVGYCISVRGVGHYIPVRHKFDTHMGEKDPNVSAAGAEEQIKRLCHEAQPELTPEGLASDPLGSSKIAVPPRVVIYFWHAKFDQEFLLPVCGIDFWHPDSFEDGMLGAYALYTDDKNLGLKPKALQRLRVVDPDKDDAGKHPSYPYEMIEFKDLFPKGLKKGEMNFQDLYPEDGNPVTLYGCSDAICTELLCEKDKVDWDYAVPPAEATYKSTVEPMAKGLYAGTYRLEQQTVQAVRLMERSRTLIDLAEIDRLLTLANQELTACDKRIMAQAKAKGFKNFNPASPAQLADFLFSERGLDLKPKPEKTKTGQYRTDADTLEKLAKKTGIDTLKLFVRRRQVEKTRGTYLKGMQNNCDDQHQLRFNFKQTGTVTGRFSAPNGREDQGFSGIPIQGIPSKHDPERPEVANSLRRIFIAHDGYVLAKVDYAGQELRILANLSKEPLWTKEFMEGDGDLHSLTTEAFFPGIQRGTPEFAEKRKMGKQANFALAYGGGVQAIMLATKCDKVEAARKKAAFDKSVPVFAKWLKRQHGIVKNQLGVTTAFRRFIAIPDANVKLGDFVGSRVLDDDGEVRKIRAGCERKSVNYPIQGTGADICKIAMIKCTKEFSRRGWLHNGDDSVRLIMTVHDEIVFEIRKDRLQEALEGVIIPCMESPADIAGWEIPLIVEPLVGAHWGSKHDWLKIMKGEEPVPDFLEGVVDPGAPPPAAAPPPATPAPTSPAARPPPTPAPEAAPFSPPTPEVSGDVATFALPYQDCLPRSSQKLVRKAIGGAAPNVDERDQAKRLRLVDAEGNILIDHQELDIYIIPDVFGRELRDRNLGKGAFDLTPE